MIRFNCLLVLAGVFQVIAAQGPPRFPPGRGPPGFENIPEKCRGPPQGVENPEQCCQLKPIFTENDLATCGFKKIGEDFQDRRGPPDCSRPICLLKIYDLVDENNQIDYPAVGKHLSEWAESDEVRSSVSIAEAVCLQGNVPGPQQICEQARMMHCIAGVMFGNCPQSNWQQTDSCKALKDHMEDCRPKEPFQ